MPWPRWSEHARAVGVVGTVVSVGVLAEWRANGLASPRAWLPDLAVGVALAVAAAVVLQREEGGRLGWLLAVAAITWFAANFADEETRWVAWTAAWLALVHRAVIGQALITYPSGRIKGWAERTTILAAYAIVLVPALARDDWWTLWWATGLFVAYLVLVRRRTALARAAGLEALPAMVILWVTLAGVATLLLTSGAGPVPEVATITYEVGIVATVVVFTVRAAGMATTDGRAGGRRRRGHVRTGRERARSPRPGVARSDRRGGVRRRRRRPPTLGRRARSDRSTAVRGPDGRSSRSGSMARWSRSWRPRSTSRACPTCSRPWSRPPASRPRTRVSDRGSGDRSSCWRRPGSGCSPPPTRSGCASASASSERQARRWLGSTRSSTGSCRSAAVQSPMRSSGVATVWPASTAIFTRWRPDSGQRIWRAEAWRRPSVSSPTAARISTELRLTGPLDVIEPDSARAIYFVCAEALANAVRHARATRVSIHARASRRSLGLADRRRRLRWRRQLGRFGPPRARRSCERGGRAAAVGEPGRGGHTRCRRTSPREVRRHGMRIARSTRRRSASRAGGRRDPRRR